MIISFRFYLFEMFGSKKKQVWPSKGANMSMLFEMYCYAY